MQVGAPNTVSQVTYDGPLMKKSEQEGEQDNSDAVTAISRSSAAQDVLVAPPLSSGSITPNAMSTV